MMSHAAIDCRGYGLPVMTGTGKGISQSATGQMLRVNRITGQATIPS